MKNSIITLHLLLLFLPVISQNSRFEFGRYNPAIKKEKLSKARYVNEIMPEFSRYVALPHEERLRLDAQLKLSEEQKLKDQLNGFYTYPHEIYNLPLENYGKVLYFVSMEISALCNGKVLRAESTSDVLNKEQKNILNAADLGTDISIKIRFRYKSQAGLSFHDLNEVKQGMYTVTLIPDTEAEYPGGSAQLNEYLNKNIIDKITGKNAFDKIQRALVRFTITEEGKLVDARLSRTSTDPVIDKLVLDAIHKMPDWKPAKNLNGIKVKQEFSIPFGGGGC